MFKFKFEEKDALKKVGSPLEYQHMKWMKFNLNNIGGWPVDMSDKTKPPSLFQRYFTFIITNMTLVSQLIYIVNNNASNTLFVMGQMYITFMLNIVCSARCIIHCTDKYKKIVKTFINDVHLFHHKHVSKYALQTHIMVHKIFHYYTMYLGFLVISVMVLYCTTPMYSNISSGAFKNYRHENETYVHAIHLALPFDCFTDIKGYITILILTWILAYNTTTLFGNFDLLLFMMIIHLCGHIKILMNDLQSIPEPKTNRIMFTQEENRTVFIKLRECIKKHNFIINFAAEMSEAYDEVLAIYYLFFQDLEAVTRYGPLTFVIYQQLIQISIIFEQLGIVSEKLPKAVYDIPWTSMNTSNRKMVQILLLNSQKPIQLKALSMLNVGVQTMGSILKSSISYFVMLRTIDNN